MSAPVIGVLALQGDVREHQAMLHRAGAETLRVRRPEELDRVDGIVMPGGESTTMYKLARTFELFEPLRAALRGGLPGFGTCAGMIMLADRIEGGTPDQETIGGLDVVVRRNAFGRQVDSFEADLDVDFGGGPRGTPSGRCSSGHRGWRRSATTSASSPRWPPETRWVGSSRSGRRTCSPRRSIPRSPATRGSTSCSWTWSREPRAEGRGTLACQATPNGRPPSTRRRSSTPVAASSSRS